MPENYDPFEEKPLKKKKFSWCFIGLHSWTKWSELIREQETFPGFEGVPASSMMSNRCYQKRECLACGMIDIRNHYIGI